MKKLKVFLTLLLMVGVTFTFAANKATLVSSTQEETIIKFNVDSYDFQRVITSRGEALIITAPNTGRVLEEGAPDVPRMSAAVIIPDKPKMKVEVIDSTYTELQDMEIAPSKGNLSREIDPRTVPYIYGKTYDKDAFFPSALADMGDPYIVRDYRGQAVIVHPFQYNPVTKVLRIYTEFVVRVSSTGQNGKNIFHRNKPLGKLNPAFRNLYADHFINFDPIEISYTPLADGFGKYLIVCYTGFMSNMADFVSWKESIGYDVDLVNYSTIGSSAALKTYVANYYNTNGLTYLLLVGDHAQVPTSSTTAGDSDNNYGYIVGSDRYLDIFVGRFSAETTDHVNTQVARTIHYERDVLATADFFDHAIGMASNEGPGHNNEYDAVHMDHIMNDLTGYGYTIHKNYQDGGSTTNLTNLINNGAGSMWYCGHGSDTSWSCGWTFSNTNVDALVNENELPFIYSVACVVGNFKSTTCFCEAWLRSTNNGNPTGSVAHAGSTINQSWNPPMDAQDEFSDILIAGSKRTFAGVFTCGLFKMIDINGSGGADMADTWTIFGDPSVQLRTPGTPNGPTPANPDPPVANFTGNPTSLMAGGNVAFTDTSTNSPTSWAWTFQGGSPATSTAQNPTVTYSAAGSYTVELTATNSAGNDTETKVGYITVTALQAPVADFSASATNIYTGTNVSFTDLTTNNPTSWSWTFPGGTPSSSSAQNPSVTYNTAGTYNVSLTASNASGNDTETKVGYITVSVPPISYCSSASTTITYEWIAGVTVAGMTKTSGAAYYSDFTSTQCNLTAGNNASVSLTPGFASSSYTEYWRIWIDYNHDGDFEDSGENVFSGSGSSVVTGSFTVSAGAASGLTRMRVSMKYSAYPTSCETFTYGEVEDYTANITGATPQPPVADFTADDTTVYVGNTVNFTDLSTNTPTSWSWTFTGGTPSTSTTQNPSVVYNSAGTYTVSLTATNAQGSDNETKTGYITVSVQPTTATIGYTTVFGSTSTQNYRRALPFTMSQGGTITSITMYHTGGSGGLILAVYTGTTTPGTRIAVTPTATVSGTTGWQTVNLTTPVHVNSGTKIWLAWVYQSNPGIRYTTGTPGRYQSSQTWSGGMPDPFGTGTFYDYIYSIYATYTPD